MKKNVRLVAVGDISLGDFPRTFGFGVRSVFERKGGAFFGKEISKILHEADISSGNLECVLSDHGNVPTDLNSAQMRGSPDAITMLVKSGLNILSVANNHMMQHGETAFHETVSLLRKNGIAAIGVADKNGKSIPYHTEINGLEICILGYSLRPEKFNSPPLYAKGEYESILNDIENYKKECDILVVSLHWGDEFVDFPSPLQVKYAHKFINSGVNVILGHHPHVLQGIEHYNGGLIAYSLGNFVFDFWQRKLRETMVLNITLTSHKIEEVTTIPIKINKSYIPEILNGQKAKALDKRIQQLSEYLVNGAEYPPYSQDQYERLVRKKLLINQLQNRFFFLRSIYKYPRGIARQSLMDFIKSR